MGKFVPNWASKQILWASEEHFITTTIFLQKSYDPTPTQTCEYCWKSYDPRDSYIPWIKMSPSYIRSTTALQIEYTNFEKKVKTVYISFTSSTNNPVTAIFEICKIDLTWRGWR